MGKFTDKLHEALAVKAHNLHDWIIGYTHRSWSVLFDEMLMDGTLNQTERMALSSIIGDSLRVFSEGLTERLPEFRDRARWDSAPDDPVVTFEGVGEAVEGLVTDQDLMASRSLFVKSVSAPVTFTSQSKDRIGGWLVLYGDSGTKDIQGDFFDDHTVGMLEVFNVTKCLPYLYNHGGDPYLKGSPVGVIDTIEEKDIGLWYEAQLNLSTKYAAAVQGLIEQGVLGTSSGAIPRSVVKSTNGHIKSWTIYEGSGTPCPVDPRQLTHPLTVLEKAIGKEFLEGLQQSKSYDSLDAKKAQLELLLLNV